MVQDNIEIYKQHFNLNDAKFSLISHADAIVGIVYKIIPTDGKALILKICDQPQHYFKELYFLKYFAGKLPIAKVVDLAEPSPGMHGAILMECLPGAILHKENLTTDISRELGILLAKVHLNRMPKFGDLMDPKSMVEDPRTYFALKFEESCSECRDHLPPNMLNKCEEYYREHRDDLLAVDGPCIIHRDFRPGNILADNGKVSGIIDWASGRAGFAEDDLCPLEIGEWGSNPDIKKAFLHGYATVRSVPDYAKLMPLLILNRAIAAVGFTLKIGTWNNRDAQLYQRNRILLERVLD